jgi:hypothetical protein
MPGKYRDPKNLHVNNAKGDTVKKLLDLAERLNKLSIDCLM